MSTEACAFALKNALNEIKNVCPDVTCTFIFRENGEIIAEDQSANQINISNTQEAFRALTEKTKIIGDIESVSFKGENARANITKFQDFYMANVASNNVDEKTVSNLTRVMIPTLLKLVKEIYPSTNKSTEPTQKTEQILVEPEISTPIPETCQLTVEHLGFGSFLQDFNTVLIDSALIGQWSEIYGDSQITKILIEDPVSAKSVVCEFKPFKESKYEGKSIIQLSEKNQLALKVKKGSQVTVKPLMGKSENGTLPIAEDEKLPPKPRISNPKADVISNVQSYSPIAPMNQFMVENISGIGLFGSNEFARVDVGIIARWKELFTDKQIEQISVEETLTGRKLTCKFKPMKGSDLEGKGAIQLPEKIQQALHIKKGALVVVKPIVEE